MLVIVDRKKLQQQKCRWKKMLPSSSPHSIHFDFFFILRICLIKKRMKKKVANSRWKWPINHKMLFLIEKSFIVWHQTTVHKGRNKDNCEDEKKRITARMKWVNREEICYMTQDTRKKWKVCDKNFKLGVIMLHTFQFDKKGMKNCEMGGKWET